MKTYPFVIIRWTDATSDEDWKDKDDDVVDVVDSFTVGWLVYEDATKVVLAQSITSDEGRGHEWAIPKVCIKKRIPLRLAKTVKF